MQGEQWARMAQDALTGHKKAEHCRSLDVNRVQREGCLKSEKHVNWIWWRDADEVARISYRAEQDRFELNDKER
jgi:hypothetical protein